jgi:hypothetical protein
LFPVKTLYQPLPTILPVDNINYLLDYRRYSQITFFILENERRDSLIFERRYIQAIIKYGE